MHYVYRYEKSEREQYAVVVSSMDDQGNARHSSNMKDAAAMLAIARFQNPRIVPEDLELVMRASLPVGTVFQFLMLP